MYVHTATAYMCTGGRDTPSRWSDKYIQWNYMKLHVINVYVRHANTQINWCLGIMPQKKQLNHAESTPASEWHPNWFLRLTESSMVQRHCRMIPQFSGANVAELLPTLDASAPMPQHGHVHIKWQDVGRTHGSSKKIWTSGFSWRFSSSRRSAGIGSTILFVSCLLLPFLESTDAEHV